VSGTTSPTLRPERSRTTTSNKINHVNLDFRFRTGAKPEPTSSNIAPSDWKDLTRNDSGKDDGAGGGSGGLSTGAKIGIGVGVGVVAIVFVLVGFTIDEGKQ